MQWYQDGIWRRFGLQIFCASFFSLHFALPVIAGQSIVKNENQISDSAVRLTLASLLGQMDDTPSLAEAETFLRQILANDQGNREAKTALVSILLKQGRPREALGLAQRFHAEAPENLQLLLLLADINAAVGHYAICRDLYQDALERTPNDTELVIRYADKSNLWGDFDTSEKQFRALLQVTPQDVSLRIRLARIFFSQQRYEEATGIVQGVLRQSDTDRKTWQEATLLLVDVQRMEKNYASALSTVQSALQKMPDFHEAVLAKGDLLLLDGQPAKAEGEFRVICTSTDNDLRYSALIGLGRSLIRQGKFKDSIVPLQAASVLKPQAAAPRLYLLLAQNIKGENIATNPHLKQTVSTLVAWGEALAAEGANQAAINCYRQALQNDPQHFPARLGLAQVLASSHQYSDALALLHALQADFPENSKVLMTLARIQAWDRQYTESLKQYELLIKNNPTNPSPRKEAARTAYWGKMPGTGNDYYQTIYAHKPVDQVLAQQTLPLQSQELLLPAVQTPRTETIVGRPPATPPFLIYEALMQRLPTLQGELRSQVKSILRDLEPEYRLQKATYLEQQAKYQAYDRQFIHAANSLNNLLEMQPGNEEALFDLAQAKCALGLYNCERATLQRLVQLDPAHNLAGYALQRSEQRSAPALSFGYSLWEEEGYGELAQMTREHAVTSFELPFNSQNKVIAGSHYFWEQPKQYGSMHEATGQSIGLNSVFNKYLAVSTEVLAKSYDGGLDSTTTGFFDIAVNLEDYAQLRLGYQRSEEFANTFALENDIQADHLKASIKAFPSRRLELGAGYEQIFYNDDNDQSLINGSAKFLLTDHPRSLSVSANIEHRHTTELNQYVYQGETLMDIVHPYWTPQHYLATSATLEWRHDISEFFFCGSQLHYYDVKLTGGTDSDNNPFFRTSAAWHWEFREHWTWDVEGMFHQSNQWKANFLATGLSYRF